jgi:8-oxo-dGTP pyrophosphatase MutT (NUDIX family)
MGDLKEFPTRFTDPTIVKEFPTFNPSEILPKKKRYSCGLIFNSDQDEVLLIRKNRPAWQAGFFNGIGGKIEGDETPLEAMIREAYEETTIKDNNWKDLAVLEAKDFEVNFFSIYDQDFSTIMPLTDELLYPIEVKNIFDRQYYFYNSIQRNLRFLIGLALEPYGIQKPVIFWEE